MSNNSKKRKPMGASENNKIPFIGSLRPVELIGIGLIVLAGLMYGLSKCGGGSKKPTATEIKGDSLQTDAVNIQNNPGGTAGSNVNENDERLNALRRRLYVTLDSIKMRKGPHLDSALIKILPFGEEVVDMGEYTSFEQTIRISSEVVATEPWVKIRTKQGNVGWVFGAGVRSYPKKKVEKKTEPKPETTSGTNTNGGNNTSGKNSGNNTNSGNNRNSGTNTNNNRNNNR